MTTSLASTSPPEQVAASACGSPVFAVLDTNVVLDLLLFKDDRLVDLCQALASGQVVWIATPAMLVELGHVLRRPSLAAWGQDADQIMAEAASLCCKVPACPEDIDRVPRCTDPDDQMFIDLAWRWPAPLLFSRDHALLRLARPARARHLWIGTPERWPASLDLPAHEKRQPKLPL